MKQYVYKIVASGYRLPRLYETPEKLIVGSYYTRRIGTPKRARPMLFCVMEMVESKEVGSCP